MPWNSTSPDGTKSVKDNETPMQQNTSYIETKMALDHYWNEDATNDGHHKQVESINKASDPASLSTASNALYYSRLKTAAEAPDAQKTEPFVYTQVGAVNHYLQLGFRAMVHFQGRSTNGNCTLKYSHNVTTVERTAKGLYTVTFTVAMPTDNYLILSDAIRDSASPELHGSFTISAGTTKGSVMTTALCKMVFTRNTENDKEDPLFGWVAIVGG